MNGSCETSTPGVCVCRLAFAVGLVWGLGMLILGLATTKTEVWGHEMVRVIGSIYWFFEPGTVKGALWGTLWGFLDGFIGTAVIAWIYFALKRTGGCCCCAKQPGTKTPGPDISKDSVGDDI